MKLLSEKPELKDKIPSEMPEYGYTPRIISPSKKIPHRKPSPVRLGMGN
jgi:hypothetical protein